MPETVEWIPPIVDIPSHLQSKLADKMGFQLNGYETILQAVPGTYEAHCKTCCGIPRPEYFLMENGDLWVVNKQGEIAVLPFGENEFEVKYHAKNYIPWRPYMIGAIEPRTDGNYGIPKTSFNKPFWKDYIGFQTDYFECVIFWRRNLIYRGKFDSRGTPFVYNYWEYACHASASWNIYSKIQFKLDDNGNIEWENVGDDTNPNWQPVLTDNTDTYFYTQKNCQACTPSWTNPSGTCGYVPGNGTKNNYSKWKFWDFAPSEWLENYCNQCAGGKDLPFTSNSLVDISNGKPAPSIPQELQDYANLWHQNNPGNSEYNIGTRCQEEICATKDPVFCGFQITGCVGGCTARFVVENNTWNDNKWYRFIKYYNTEEEIPGYWRPESSNLDYTISPLCYTFANLAIEQTRNPDSLDLLVNINSNVHQYSNLSITNSSTNYGTFDDGTYSIYVSVPNEEITLHVILKNEYTDNRLAGKIFEYTFTLLNEEGNTTEYINELCTTENWVTLTLKSIEVYNANENGLKDFDVVAVLDGWESIPENQRASQASWYFLRHEYWFVGNGTLHDLMYADKDVMFGFLFQDELTSIDSCKSEDDIPVVPGGNLICCGDWWAANFGTSSANRVLGFRGTLLLKAPGVAYTGVTPSNSTEVMQEEMVCCPDANWMFVRYSIGNDSQMNELWAIQRNSSGVIIGAYKTWAESTNYAGAWHACCSNNRPTSDNVTKHSYLTLQNLWNTKRRALFYNGQFLQIYDWSNLSCGDLLGRSSTGCQEWIGNRLHAEQCIADETWCNYPYISNVDNKYTQAKWDIWQEGVKIHSCIEVCSIQNYYDEVPSLGEPTWLFLKGMDITIDKWLGGTHAFSNTVECTFSTGVCRYQHSLSNTYITGTLHVTRAQWKKYGIILETGTVYIREAGTGSRQGIVGSGNYGSSPMTHYLFYFGGADSGWAMVGNVTQTVWEEAMDFAPSIHCQNSSLTNWNDASCVCSPFPTGQYSNNYYFHWTSPTNRGFYLTDVSNLIAAEWDIADIYDNTYGGSVLGCHDYYERNDEFSMDFIYYDPKRYCRANLPTAREIPINERFFEVATITHEQGINSNVYSNMGDGVSSCEPTPVLLHPYFSTSTLTVPYIATYGISPSGGYNDILRVESSIRSNTNTTDPCLPTYNNTRYSTRVVFREDYTCTYDNSSEEWELFQFSNAGWFLSQGYSCQAAGIVETCASGSYYQRANCLATEIINCSSYYNPPVQPSINGSWTFCYATIGTTCYGWKLDNLDLVDPDNTEAKLIPSDGYQFTCGYGSIEGSNCTNNPLANTSPDCGYYVFSCSNNRISVQGSTSSSIATTVKVTVIDKENKNLITFNLPYPYPRQFTFSARCCGPYWELRRTQSGVTTFDIYHMGTVIESELLTTDYYMSCCTTGYNINQDSNVTGNSDGELATLFNKDSADRFKPYKIWNCGLEITSQISNLEHFEDGEYTYRATCCGKYAIISTGLWKMNYDSYRNIARYQDGTANRIDTTTSYATLPDGTILQVKSVTTKYGDGWSMEYVSQWEVSGKPGWTITDYEQYQNGETNSDAYNYVTNKLNFKHTISNTRQAQLFYCDELVVTDRRLETIKCLKCGEDTFALAPIFDDIDLQRWSLWASYSRNTEDCSFSGEIFIGKWIHNESSKLKEAPTLEEKNKQTLAQWFDAYPMMGIYIVHNGLLQSMNAGYGNDIQEKFPPDDAYHTPEGGYWYINDRNAAVRYDKSITNSDQAWNHDCYNIPITLSAQSLDDLPAAPAQSCQGKKEISCIEGSNRGRIVISGNNVLRIFDSAKDSNGNEIGHGKMDFDASTFCQLS